MKKALHLDASALTEAIRARGLRLVAAFDSTNLMFEADPGQLPRAMEESQRLYGTSAAWLMLATNAADISRDDILQKALELSPLEPQEIVIIPYVDGGLITLQSDDAAEVAAPSTTTAEWFRPFFKDRAP